MSCPCSQNAFSLLTKSSDPSLRTRSKASKLPWYRSVDGSLLVCPLGFITFLSWLLQLPPEVITHHYIAIITGFPGGTSRKEPACQCRRHKSCEFSPWVGKIPWGRKWQPTPVFLPGESMDGGAWWATVHGSQRVRHDWVVWYIPCLSSPFFTLTQGNCAQINQWPPLATWELAQVLGPWHLPFEY